MAHILIIDDNETLGYALRRAFSRQGHEVLVVQSAQDVAEYAEESFDIVFLDISLPDGNGLTLLPGLLAGPGRPEVVVITGYDNDEWLEQALAEGAWDYIRKDDSLDTILTALEQVLLFHKNRCARRGNNEALGNDQSTLLRDKLIGESVLISQCLETTETCANSDIYVLLTGETGTGKEVFARTIHENSKRKSGPFVTVDCAALPESLVESILFGHVRGAFTGASTREHGLVAEADGGTLFLDEVGELPLALQKIFLRVLQEKQVRPVGGAEVISCDFRLIAATNRNIEEMVQQKYFREDLFYRLQAVHLQLPPLRSRHGDVILLTEYFLEFFAQQYHLSRKKLSAGAQNALEQYDWPGNVRELRGAVEHAVITAGDDDIIYAQYLPTRIRIYITQQRRCMDKQQKKKIVHTTLPSSQLPASLDGFPLYAEYKECVWKEEEGRYLTRLLELTHYNIPEACKATGLSRSRLYALLKKHNLTS